MGFVLGARAGRPAYDRLVETYSGLISKRGLDTAGRDVRDAGADLRDAVSERASGAVKDVVNTAASGMQQAAESIRDSGSAAGGSPSG